MEKITFQHRWIDAVSTNTRELTDLAAAGHHTLFVPIVGERINAHQFLADVSTSGATAAFASATWLDSEAGQELMQNSDLAVITWDDLMEDIAIASKETSAADLCDTNFTLIRVEDTRTALQQLAAWYRGQFQIPIIGITGSVGKTTTKEMVAAALESALTIHKTAGNQNSQIGLPLTIFGLERHHQAAVIEMGMSEFGEMARIAAVAKPDHAIMTNIGVAHIGNLGSQENIRAEKLHITDFFHQDSTLLLNVDDALLAETGTHASMEEIHTLLFGEADNADFRATDIQVRGAGQEFLLHYPGGEPERITLQVLGMHNVRNALAALAIAWKLGISPKTAAIGLAAYAPLSMRGNLIEHNGIRILDDSYNASPDSMKSSIDVLSTLPLTETAKRILVLADVLELGERSADLHREVGEYLAEHNHRANDNQHANGNRHAIDHLLTIGPESIHIQQGYLDHSAENARLECHHFDTNADATAYLKNILTSGDAVLIKGSRGMKTDEIVKSLQE